MKPPRLLTWYIGPHQAWARLGADGPGLAIKDTRRAGLLFSERNHLTRFWRIGPWLIKPLKPWRTNNNAPG